MNEVLCVNMKVDQDSTFMFMQDLSAKNYLPSTSKKDEMVDGTPRRLCMSHPFFNGADFWEGDGSF